MCFVLTQVVWWRNHWVCSPSFHQHHTAVLPMQRRIRSKVFHWSVAKTNFGLTNPIFEQLSTLLGLSGFGISCQLVLRSGRLDLTLGQKELSTKIRSPQWTAVCTFRPPLCSLSSVATVGTRWSAQTCRSWKLIAPTYQPVHAMMTRRCGEFSVTKPNFALLGDC